MMQAHDAYKWAYLDPKDLQLLQTLLTLWMPPTGTGEVMIRLQFHQRRIVQAMRVEDEEVPFLSR